MKEAVVFEAIMFIAKFGMQLLAIGTQVWKRAMKHSGQIHHSWKRGREACVKAAVETVETDRENSPLDWLVRLSA